METCTWDHKCKAKNSKGYRDPDNKGRSEAQGTNHAVGRYVWEAETEKKIKPPLRNGTRKVVRWNRLVPFPPFLLRGNAHELEDRRGLRARLN